MIESTIERFWLNGRLWGPIFETQPNSGSMSASGC
jgi:hypothetical protein